MGPDLGPGCPAASGRFVWTAAPGRGHGWQTSVARPGGPAWSSPSAPRQRQSLQGACQELCPRHPAPKSHRAAESGQRTEGRLQMGCTTER